ncbi:hypothetical protein NFA_21270 [Nocardia farcinica IFM 10152]|uniref:Uncharacterized protein n=1 Tax=Nocardia farcinica (strain IFM 10152) TaxID=247156 RepID=Q5YXW8_NOCFA|nr:hypothetical protein NFA_21270 [Nocardia farcinica IFM 10152]
MGKCLSQKQDWRAKGNRPRRTAREDREATSSMDGQRVAGQPAPATRTRSTCRRRVRRLRVTPPP